MHHGKLKTHRSVSGGFHVGRMIVLYYHGISGQLLNWSAIFIPRIEIFISPSSYGVVEVDVRAHKRSQVKGKDNRTEESKRRRKEDRAARELHKLIKTDNYRCLALLLQPPVDYDLGKKAAAVWSRASLSLNVFVGFLRYGRQ